MVCRHHCEWKKRTNIKLGTYYETAQILPCRQVIETAHPYARRDNVYRKQDVPVFFVHFLEFRGQWQFLFGFIRFWFWCIIWSWLRRWWGCFWWFCLFHRFLSVFCLSLTIRARNLSRHICAIEWFCLQSCLAIAFDCCNEISATITVQIVERPMTINVVSV